MGRPVDVGQARAAQPDVRRGAEPRRRRLAGRATDVADSAHPSCALDDRPDELMIAWGNVPTGTRASIYLPTVDAAAALDWAHRMYVSNRLWLVDGHTLACEAGGVTFVPVPGASDVDHVGLMAVELPPTVHKGERYSVRVRQLTGACLLYTSDAADE